MWPTSSLCQEEFREGCYLIWSVHRPSGTNPSGGRNQQIRDFTNWDISSEKQRGKFSMRYTTSQRGKITVEWEKNWKSSSSAVLPPHHLLSLTPSTLLSSTLAPFRNILKPSHRVSLHPSQIWISSHNCHLLYKVRNQFLWANRREHRWHGLLGPHTFL